MPQTKQVHPESLGVPVGSAMDGWVPPGAVRVPLPGVSDQPLRLHRIIRFRNLRRKSYSKGVHLSDLFRPDEEPSTLEGASDVILDGYGGGKLKLVINWPGYQPERCTISTVSIYGGPLTRRELAQNIMYAYGNFFRKVVEKRIQPNYAGFYKIAFNQCNGTKIPDPAMGVQFAQLHLVELHEPLPNSDDEHWAAAIDILDFKYMR